MRTDKSALRDRTFNQNHRNVNNLRRAVRLGYYKFPATAIL
ncbi:hypothetical protein [Rivularia sp. UHCC 0363]|nr:hypothetical protein [Rivularia sp. UHCC 0363]MEA5594173.1 hypothetical protein [Rivularia sp. UHCC 0363]